eukprot:CAMPEP_0116873562 /NCGR_PEP_ID=MMETSP0463-20121206/4772_1 /TAXON_ID=181622 /ORGANISM="Strombidinopsis sp, Strain SopsisLIS2011" /LENGTH=63 /DNA_ID=CAMNT_0004515827 /DNA_START=518 /DNA_END=709 /DNA_ORIENTATION=+
MAMGFNFGAFFVNAIISTYRCTCIAMKKSDYNRKAEEIRRMKLYRTEQLKGIKERKAQEEHNR